MYNNPFYDEKEFKKKHKIAALSTFVNYHVIIIKPKLVSLKKILYRGHILKKLLIFRNGVTTSFSGIQMNMEELR